MFDSCGHVLLFCGCKRPGHRHSPFTADIVMPSGQRQENCFCGAPTQMYEHLLDLSQAFVPVCTEWPNTFMSIKLVIFSDNG